MCRLCYSLSANAAANARSNCWRHQYEWNHKADADNIQHQVLIPRHIERIGMHMTSAMLNHVVNPPGRPLAGVLWSRPEDDGCGAHDVSVRTIVDDVTSTCDQLLNADVSHAAEIDAIATVLQTSGIVHLIGPDWKAQLWYTVVQRLYKYLIWTEFFVRKIQR